MICKKKNPPAASENTVGGSVYKQTFCLFIFQIFVDTFCTSFTCTHSKDYCCCTCNGITTSKYSWMRCSTNLISLDRARPLHVFDADKLRGNLRARLAKDGEALTALDQVRQRVDEFRNLPRDAETPEVSRVSRYEPIARLLVRGSSVEELRPWVRRFESELLAA